MTADRAKELLALAALAGRYTEAGPNWLAAQIWTLQTKARQHDRAMTDDCNGAPWSAERLAKLRREINAIATEIGCTGTLFTGDPRGYTVRVHWSGGEHNSWGGREAGYVV